MWITTYFFQRLSAALHYAIGDLDRRHAPGKACTCITIRDVADELETELPSIQLEMMNQHNASDIEYLSQSVSKPIAHYQYW